MQATGILKLKNDTEVVSDRFKKRTFVLTTEASTPYPQHVEFMLTQDKVNLLDKFKIGDSLNVSFNLRGKEWNGQNGVRYFNTLEAWLIQSVGEERKNDNTRKSNVDDSEDLPF